MTNLSLEKMTVLITGGNKGIGLAISKKLIESGCKIISLGRTEFESFHPDFSHFKCDISDSNSFKNTLLQITETNPEINILINNAGISDFSPFVDSALEFAEKIIQTNLISAINLTHFILPQLFKRKSGMIINMASIAVRENFANCSVYNASKSGLLSFSRSLRNEVRQSGIKIIDIIAGATLTGIWDKESQEIYGERMMLPEDIASAVYECISMSLNNRLMIEEIVITPQKGNI